MELKDRSVLDSSVHMYSLLTHHRVVVIFSVRERHKKVAPKITRSCRDFETHGGSTCVLDTRSVQRKGTKDGCTIVRRIVAAR